MKKILLILLAMVILSGCSYTLTDVKNRYGTPARVEIECVAGTVCDENTYYNNKSSVEYIFWFYYWKKDVPWTDGRHIQEWCLEVRADKNGKVIHHSRYVAQPSNVESSRTVIEAKGRKLPGVE